MIDGKIKVVGLRARIEQIINCIYCDASFAKINKDLMLKNLKLKAMSKDAKIIRIKELKKQKKFQFKNF